MVNATGWNELYDGNMFGAVYTMYDTAFGSMGIIVVMLFIVYEIILYSKTQNIALCFITGLFFVSLYGLSQYVEPASLGILFLLLLFELGAILYTLLNSK